MRHFIYFSSKAVTSGKALRQNGLMKAGRMDIAIHSFIQAVYLSEDFRDDVIFHFIFYGMPDPPKHIQIQVTEDLGLNKKDIVKILTKLLYKYKEGEKTEVFPKCFVEKKNFLKVIEELSNQGNQIFILDKNGESLRKTKITNTPVFIIGDHEGLPKPEMKKLKQITTKISIGPKMYFASQTIAVVNNELDFRGI